MPRTACLYSIRDLRTGQKRPVYIAKKHKRPILRQKRPVFWQKRHISRQKRPVYLKKKAYLHTGQKRPVYEAKQAYFKAKETCL